MTILKKILHVIFSAFLVWQTIILIERLLNSQPSDFAGMLVDAMWINLFVTGIFTIVYSFPVYKILPVNYYAIKSPGILKLSGKIIQIDLFRQLLMSTIWNKRHNKKHFFNGYRSGFYDFEIATKRSEFGHFAGFCMVFLIALVTGIKADLMQAFMILLINILFNFYPFMLQRVHRSRLNELKRKSGMIET